jgi:hypothetical protein
VKALRREDWTSVWQYPLDLQEVWARVMVQGGWNYRDFYAFGAAAGYPECCILDFVADVQHGRSPAERRSLVQWSPYYVPCRSCAKEMAWLC